LKLLLFPPAEGGGENKTSLFEKVFTILAVNITAVLGKSLNLGNYRLPPTGEVMVVFQTDC
jgi:hypothetical protein